MRDAAPEKIHLADYRPPAYLIDSVALSFALHPTATRVKSRIAFRPNPEAPEPFVLDGTDLTLIEARIDGAPVQPTLTDEGLTCAVPDAPFTWEAEVEINPEANTTLEGLYMSAGFYCTQCEAQGFRRITYYPDRPDVMAPFTVRIDGDAPVLLSNGNPAGAGEGWAEWHDPWPKPSYLFALVAGDLVAASDSFTTCEGRAVEINLWTRPRDADKTAWAIEAIKLSMDWDERVYGRAYDLEVFNVVAVDDFNGGAMENKGLNLFNSALVLASPETATDAAYERIESVIAHEYFHNWTGNRITCRDWFQLCLKEGLTVFRDQQFTSDVRSAPVKRIEDARFLRAHQFREDGGPLAHPVRPESFVEIDNFYTLTVYEKGAEVIGMLKRLVGDEAYARALDLYFTRHDGEACTIEDWLTVFEDATGRDLTQFKRWYSQAGTPRVTVTDSWQDGCYRLTFRQQTPPTPDQPDKAPVVIPMALGLLAEDGTEIMPTCLVELTEAETTVTYDPASASVTTGGDVKAAPLAQRPIPSLLRGFSAPVILDTRALPDHRAHLLAHDTDPFVRWDAGESLARSALKTMVAERAPADAAWLDALTQVVTDESQDPAFRALCLSLPTEDAVAQDLRDAGIVPDPTAIYSARKAAQEALAQRITALPDLYARHRVTAPYAPTPDQTGPRALANSALHLMTKLDPAAAQAQFASADNLTDSLAALAALRHAGQGAAEDAAFEQRWADEPLVLDSWMGLQIGADPANGAATADRLTRHPGFDPRNPNRVRAVLGGLMQTRAAFHAPDGAGYALLADWIIRLDSQNPKMAARLGNAFQTWRWYDADRQALARAQLDRIAATESLSRDVSEIVTRLLQ